MTESSTPPMVPGVRRFSTRAVTLVALAALIVGALIGLAADRAALRHRWGFGRGEFGGLPFGSRASGPGGQHRLNDRIARELDLTPAQRARIDSIMARRIRDIEQVRQEVSPRMRQIFSGTRAEIDSVLTPAQRDRMHELFPRRHGARDEHPARP